MEPSIALGLFDKTLSVLSLVREGKNERNKKIDQALLALYGALIETRLYQTERRQGLDRNPTREASLARLWSTASVPLREIDPHLADRCLLKTSYWLEPGAWDEEQVKSLGITLDQVFEATRALLIS